jgi:hypothetical protein
MARTRIYLTETEKAAFNALGNATDRTQSNLIRKAVLNKAAGLWKARKDLPDFRSVRKGWDR